MSHVLASCLVHTGSLQRIWSGLHKILLSLFLRVLLSIFLRVLQNALLVVQEPYTVCAGVCVDADSESAGGPDLSGCVCVYPAGREWVDHCWGP